MAEQVNGYKVFSIRLAKTGIADETLNFSNDYQALKEYDMSTAVRHIFLNGSKKKKVLFVNLRWVIDWSGALEKPDALQVNKVKNAEYQGKTIYLTPHSDVPREFKVQIVEKERELGKHYGDQANKDYIIEFENVDAITEYNWVDPDLIAIGATGTTDTPMEGEQEL